MFDCKRIHPGELVDAEAIATFRAERDRGIRHTRMFEDKMQRELDFFDEVQIRIAQVERLRAAGGHF